MTHPQFPTDLVAFTKKKMFNGKLFCKETLYLEGATYWQLSLYIKERTAFIEVCIARNLLQSA